MKRAAPLLLFLGLLFFGGYFLYRRSTSKPVVETTITPTASSTPSSTVTASDTATATPTNTPTPTFTWTPTYTYTPSATLATRVFPVVFVNAGVHDASGIVTYAPQTLVASTSTPSVTSLPSNTPSPTNTVGPGTPPPPSWTPSQTPTASSTVTNTSSPSASPTVSATPTASLTLTASQAFTMVVPPPPQLSDLTVQNGASQGWVRYEASDPAITWQGSWQIFGDKPNQTTYRSAGKLYKYSNAKDAAMSLTFHGGAVRVRYAGCAACGVFEVRIDGRVMREVDSFYSKQADANGFFGTTEYWSLASGNHVIDVVSMNRKNPISTDTTVAIDAIEVYRTDVPTSQPTVMVTSPAGSSPFAVTAVVPTSTATSSAGSSSLAPIGPMPTMMVTSLAGSSPFAVTAVAPGGLGVASSLTPTATLVLVGQPELIQAPPAIPPTIMPDQPVAMSIMFTVSYNTSKSGAVMPSEGVPGVSVRLVDVFQNRVVASGITDQTGIVRLTVTTNHDIRLLVPYFGQVYDIGRASSVSLTLLIPAGNIPGLIP